jgi:transposase
MSDDMEDLARRLVVGRKSDGRSVYDEAAKAELVAACGRPGASVSRLARECGINANQLSRWVREHSQRRQRAVAVSSPPGQAFVAVPIEAAAPMPMVTGGSPPVGRMTLQARLPNGVVVDLRECDARHVATPTTRSGGCRASTNPRAVPPRSATTPGTASPLGTSPTAAQRASPTTMRGARPE